MKSLREADFQNAQAGSDDLNKKSKIREITFFNRGFLKFLLATVLLIKQYA